MLTGTDSRRLARYLAKARVGAALGQVALARIDVGSLGCGRGSRFVAVEHWLALACVGSRWLMLGPLAHTMTRVSRYNFWSHG